MKGPGDVIHRRIEVAARRQSGDYTHLTIVDPEIAAWVRPGQVLMIYPPGRGGLPVALFVHRSSPQDASGGSVELVVHPLGERRVQIAATRPGEELLVTGPVGRPFPVPREPVGIVMVGHNWGSAPLAWFAENLQERGHAVEVLLTADRVESLVGLTNVRRRLGQVSLATLDGSTGARCGPGEALPEVLRRTGAGLVYACAPPRHTASIVDACVRHGVACQVVAPVGWPCGTGICGACAVPLIDQEGQLAPIRACTRGPAVPAERLHPSYLAELAR